MSNLDPTQPKGIEGVPTTPQTHKRKSGSPTKLHQEEKVDTISETIRKTSPRGELPLPEMSEFPNLTNWKKVIEIWKKEHPELQEVIDSTFSKEHIDLFKEKISKISKKSQLFFKDKEIQHISLKEIAKGLSKTVDKIFHLKRQTFEAFAIEFRTLEEHASLGEEAEISKQLQELGVPNIISFHELTTKDGFTAAWMELCEIGDLFHALELTEPLTRDQLDIMLYEAAKSFTKMHQVGFVHRDIKPQNILVKKGFEIRIGDLGTVTKKDKVPGFVGTFEYAAPELSLEDALYGEKQDAWSFGAILYYFVTGDTVVEEQLSTQLREGTIDPYTFFELIQKHVEGIDWVNAIEEEKVRKMVQGLLDTNPETRWTIEMALPTLKSVAGILNGF